MTVLRLRVNEATVYEGPTISVPRVGEQIHHGGKLLRVEALVWDFGGAAGQRTYDVDVSLTVGAQPYTF